MFLAHNAIHNLQTNFDAARSLNLQQCYITSRLLRNVAESICEFMSAFDLVNLVGIRLSHADELHGKIDQGYFRRSRECHYGLFPRVAWKNVT